MSESKPTPGLLRIWENGDGELGVEDSSGNSILLMESEFDKANAKRLVKCWNSHDDLLDNLRKANEELTRCRRTKGYAQKQNGLIATLQKEIRTAISKAEKG